MRFSKTLLLAMGLTTISFAAEAKQTICVFDFVGKNGDVNRTGFVGDFFI
ncbi:hypothetical protein IAG34_18510 [Acinetobacter baumannii]|nr:hypothetical protein IAG34_18510 [Acinetobacter baumannii]